MKALAQAVRLLTVLPWPGAHREPEADDMARVLVQFSLRRPPYRGGPGRPGLGACKRLSRFGAQRRTHRRAHRPDPGFSLGGLSDFADTLGLGNHAKQESTGALLIIGALLLKFVSLSELQGNERYLALVLSPMLARTAMAYLIASSPSMQEVETGGRGFSRQSSPREGYFALGWSFLFCFLLGWFWGLFLAIIALCVTWGLKRLPRQIGQRGERCARRHERNRRNRDARSFLFIVIFFSFFFHTCS